MIFGNQTHWDSENETIEHWLERERLASERVENPTCPHCDYIIEDWWEYTSLRDAWEVTKEPIDCPNCSVEFFVDKGTQVRFKTFKTEISED